MLKLKTNKEFTFPIERGIKTGIIRLIVDNLFIDDNNIVPSGYYYYFNDSGQAVKLDDIARNPVLWSDVALAETQLSPLASTGSFKTDLWQRVKEFTFLRLQSENGTNYGTLSTDWIIDND